MRARALKVWRELKVGVTRAPKVAGKLWAEFGRDAFFFAALWFLWRGVGAIFEPAGYIAVAACLLFAVYHDPHRVREEEG